MNLTDPSFNLATAFLLGMVVFIFFSVLRLFVYFFGGRSPLRWNAEARVEAAQNPANVLQADREFQNRRNMLWLLFLIAVACGMVALAPEQSRVLLDAIILLLTEIAKVLRDSVNSFLAARGG
jgi:hypothetical protein